MFIKENRNSYSIAQRMCKCENKLRFSENEIQSKGILNLSCIKLEGKIIKFNKNMFITFLLDFEECEDEIEREIGLLILKIGKNQLYYKDNDIVLISERNEVKLIKEHPLYRIEFLRDMEESIEISGDCNFGKDNKCYLSELRIYENNEIISDYIFSSPFIGKDLINRNDLRLEIIDGIKMKECESHRYRLLKESESIYNYGDEYYINKREIEKAKKVDIQIELYKDKEWEEFVICLSVFSYIYFLY